MQFSGTNSYARVMYTNKCYCNPNAPSTRLKLERNNITLRLKKSRLNMIRVLRVNTITL